MYLFINTKYCCVFKGGVQTGKRKREKTLPVFLSQNWIMNFEKIKLKILKFFHFKQLRKFYILTIVVFEIHQFLPKDIST